MKALFLCLLLSLAACSNSNPPSPGNPPVGDVKEPWQHCPNREPCQ